jgi:riboflavin kinase/FMN adenylyltransferase
MSETSANPADSAQDAVTGTALVIGNFDGVHRGHQALVSHTLELARRHHLRALAMTFEPHPAAVLGGAAPPVLTSTPRKVKLLSALAPNFEVLVQRFDSEFAQLSPREFVERILVRDIRVRQLVVGANFRFGRDRAGNVNELQKLGQEFAFAAHGVELTSDVAGSISSSRIRRLLTAGEVAEAASLLGRPHSVSGIVVAGDGRGRTIGVPTANLEGIPELAPKAGVYAGIVEIDGAATTSTLGPAVVHIGPRPTVDRNETVEVHLIDRNLDLYGRSLRVGFHRRLRDVIRFSDIESLKRQIALDIETARRELEANV